MKLQTFAVKQQMLLFKSVNTVFGCYYSSIFTSQFVYFTFPVVIVVLLTYVTYFGAWYEYFTTRSKCV